jgi:peroxiredoxin
MLTIGTTAPDFALSSKTADGLNLVKLSDHKGQNVVLLFFPMVYTSVCTDEFCAVSKGLADFAGATVLGISGDNPFAQEAWAQKEGITVTLASDYDHKVAQAYGIDLSIGTQIMILLTLMISSKGIAAVPRASLVVITGTLAMFGLPVEGVAIILAIDQFLDMGRTATNVVGNAVATAVITKWEGMLEVEEPAYVEHPHAPAHTAADGRAGLELDESNFEDGKG